MLSHRFVFGLFIAACYLSTFALFFVTPLLLSIFIPGKSYYSVFFFFKESYLVCCRINVRKDT